jgi:apolipoprotein D and lipocalin family protein
MTNSGVGLVLLVSMSLIALAGAVRTSEPLTTVPSVDVKRYVGTWYEIARYPNRFQKACLSDTTANYTLLASGIIEVLNSCRQANGSMKTARGKAKIVDTISNARLKVTFFWPFYGDYWIIGLAPDYSYAIVGEPRRDYLWILSRSPKMSGQTYAEVLERIRAAGYDTSRLIQTPQSGS